MCLSGQLKAGRPPECLTLRWRLRCAFTVAQAPKGNLMPFVFEQGLRLTWMVVLGYWLWSARGAKRPAAQEPFVVRLIAYWLPLLVAMLLLGPGPWFGHSLLREQFVPHNA